VSREVAARLGFGGEMAARHDQLHRFAIARVDSFRLKDPGACSRHRFAIRKLQPRSHGPVVSGEIDRREPRSVRSALYQNLYIVLQVAAEHL